MFSQMNDIKLIVELIFEKGKHMTVKASKRALRIYGSMNVAW